MSCAHAWRTFEKGLTCTQFRHARLPRRFCMWCNWHQTCRTNSKIGYSLCRFCRLVDFPLFGKLSYVPVSKIWPSHLINWFSSLCGVRKIGLLSVGRKFRAHDQSDPDPLYIPTPVTVGYEPGGWDTHPQCHEHTTHNSAEQLTTSPAFENLLSTLISPLTKGREKEIEWDGGVRLILFFYHYSPV